MLRNGLCVLALLGVLGCKKDPPVEQPKRIELKSLGENRVEFIPAEGQFPYCHIFTRSDSGVLRQLTMTHDNLSLPCPAGEPVGRVTFRVPVDEGPITALVLFTDQQVNGSSMGLQLLDLPKDQAPGAWNLRVPGRAVTEVLRFTPSADAAPEVGPDTTTGAPVGSDGNPLKPAAPEESAGSGVPAVPEDANAPADAPSDDTASGRDPAQ